MAWAVDRAAGDVRPRRRRPPPLSQDELAGWTGPSREAVTKALRTLREDGWIRTGRLRVVVTDLASLKERAG